MSECEICGLDPCASTCPLGAMQARAEKAEAELRGAFHRARMLFDAKNEWADRARAAEARLAEVGPVVEAAERVVDTSFRAHWTDQEGRLFAAVGAMRAARSLRGAGEGGGA